MKNMPQHSGFPYPISKTMILTRTTARNKLGLDKKNYTITSSLFLLNWH